MAKGEDGKGQDLATLKEGTFEDAYPKMQEHLNDTVRGTESLNQMKPVVHT
jgi:hypothetical protein